MAKVKREHANNVHADGDDGQESRGSSGADAKSVLRVIRQPPEIFYKDEGGKRAMMQCEIELCTGTGPGEGSSFGTLPMPLDAILVYENGEEVDEDIVTVENSKERPLQMDPVVKRTQIFFRIDKVSRRMNNRQFRLKVTMGELSCTTSPVRVCSKRKVPKYMRNDPVAIEEFLAAQRMSQRELKLTMSSRKRPRSGSSGTTPYTSPQLRPQQQCLQKKMKTPGDSITLDEGYFESRGLETAILTATNRANEKADHALMKLDEILRVVRDQQKQIASLQHTIDGMRAFWKVKIGEPSVVTNSSASTEDPRHVVIPRLLSPFSILMEMPENPASPTTTALPRSSPPVGRSGLRQVSSSGDMGNFSVTMTDWV